MAKVAYIYKTPHADGLTEDREWMRQYGCVQVAEYDDVKYDGLHSLQYYATRQWQAH